MKKRKEIINEDVLLKKKKQKKEKKKTFSTYLSNIFIIVLFTFLFLFIGFSYYIYIKAPEFNKNLLYKLESSNIYDSKNNLIATIGNEKRQIISYNKIPEVLKDAIISTEDSRFFEHNGFDLPRFIKATIGHLSGKDAGGASTLTMQISKNTFTSTQNKGFDGITRKFTDIYLSIFKIEKDYSKEEITEFYVNSPYLGAGSYGVEQAAKTYFGKNVENLTLVEAATIAGLFQAPGEYDPYINPDKSTQRKNEVLSLMLRHGYISEKTYDIAKEINVEDIIIEKNSNINEYQGFIDTVVQEVIDNTGNNPYEVSMDIYTTMIKEKQDIINDLYNSHKFKDNKVQLGIAVLNNTTGEIIAIGTGRNKISEMSFNYATQIKRHPGSTAKPIFDYGPGIEYYNWSTYTPFIDKATKYTNGGYIHNIDNKYLGFLTMEQCLVKSRNTCALQAFKKINNSKINTFVKALGITPEYLGNDEYINEAHSIGGFTGVSPVQLAGAYAAFANKGQYIKPHSYTKIIYKNADEEKLDIPKYEKTKAMKETTAYLITHMLENATSSKIKVKGTDIATKTGTSSYEEESLKNLGLSKKVIRDSWIVSYSPDYTVATWYGYDRLYEKYNMTSSHSSSERVKIQAKLVNKIMEQNSKFSIPKGIVATKIEIGNMTAKLPNAYTPSTKIQTHLFIKGTEPKTISNKYTNQEKQNTEKNEIKDFEISNIPSMLRPINN